MEQAQSAIIPERPRVLFVSHDSSATGAPIQLLHLARGLQKSGWDLAVATPEPGPISDLLRADGIKVIIDPRLFEEEEVGKLRELCAPFDVVVANTVFSWPAVRAARAEGKRAIWYLHETLAAIDLMRRFPKMRPTLDLASLLITPTQQTARIFRDITRTPIEMIPYGIPAPARVARRKNDGRMAFITMASLEARKGQDILVEGIKLLPNEYKTSAIFRIVGRSQDPGFAEKIKAEAAGIEAIEFTGALDHTESLALLADSDALICSSRDETMPIAILEAMSLGKLVISTDVGGIAEWLRDGLNGFLIAPEDPKALAMAIVQSVKEPARAAELGRAATRTYAQHFSLDRLERDFAHLLQNKTRAEEMGHSLNDYAEWTRRYNQPTPATRLAMQRRLRTLRRHPRISILLPVFDPPLNALRAAIDSVRQQSYGEWELCIADDASTNPAVRNLLEEIVAKETRAKIIFRERNGHISACSNSALTLASGEWCGLLDHDDVLHEDALAWVAEEINSHPDAGLIYTDQDSIDTENNRSNPFFKTDWDPLLFLGQNFINHLGVYRTELLREIRGFREGYEGSQDYDLALRCLEHLRPEQVRHIPRVLYHWRTIPGSVAASSESKPYVYTAARRAIADHLDRAKICGEVVPCPQNYQSHRVIFEITNEYPLVSIIVPTRDRLDLLQRCVESLSQWTDYPRRELIIVDNASTEPETIAWLHSIGERGIAQVVRDEGAFNFSRLSNLGAAQAKGEFLLFLNNDIEVTGENWLREMMGHALQPDIGAVGARLVFPDGKIQHAGVLLGLGGWAAEHPYYKFPREHPGYYNRAWLHHDCSAVTAACLLMRRKLFREIGGFEEEHLAISFNDVDLCLRLRARGWRIAWTPYAELVHHESATRVRERTEKDKVRFSREANYTRNKWGAELLNDPFYSPNFSLSLPGFELAYPPRER